jgi:hypothetical protein
MNLEARFLLSHEAPGPGPLYKPDRPCEWGGSWLEPGAPPFKTISTAHFTGEQPNPGIGWGIGDGKRSESPACPSVTDMFSGSCLQQPSHLHNHLHLMSFSGLSHWPNISPCHHLPTNSRTRHLPTATGRNPTPPSHSQPNTYWWCSWQPGWLSSPGHTVCLLSLNVPLLQAHSPPIPSIAPAPASPLRIILNLSISTLCNCQIMFFSWPPLQAKNHNAGFYQEGPRGELVWPRPSSCQQRHTHRRPRPSKHGT